MNNPDTGNSQNRSTARAIAWAGRIMGVSLIMILPGLVGQQIDERLGTKFFTLAGFGIGLTAGIAALLVMTKSKEK